MHNQINPATDSSDELVPLVDHSAADTPWIDIAWTRKMAAGFARNALLYGGTFGLSVGLVDWINAIYTLMVSTGLFVCDENDEDSSILFFSLLAGIAIIFAPTLFAQLCKAMEYASNYGQGRATLTYAPPRPIQKVSGGQQFLLPAATGWNMANLLFTNPPSPGISNLTCVATTWKLTVAQAGVNSGAAMVGLVMGGAQMASFFSRIKPIFGVNWTAILYTIYKIVSSIYPILYKILSKGIESVGIPTGIFSVLAIIVVSYCRFKVYHDDNQRIVIEYEYNQYNLSTDSPEQQHIDDLIRQLEAEQGRASRNEEAIKQLQDKLQKAKIAANQIIILERNQAVECQMTAEMNLTPGKILFGFLCSVLGSIALAYLTTQSFLAMIEATPLKKYAPLFWQILSGVISGIYGLEHAIRFLSAFLGYHPVDNAEYMKQIQRRKPCLTAGTN